MCKCRHGFMLSKIAVILALVLCAQVFAPGAGSGALAEGNADPEPALGVYANGDYTGIYELNDEIIVESVDQAMQAAVELGLCDSVDGLVLENVVTLGGETFYQFKQVYAGLEVFGHKVAVLTDQRDVVCAVSGDYVAIDQLEVQHEPDWDMLAGELAGYMYDAGLLDVSVELLTGDVAAAGEPVVYVDGDMPRLAYYINGNSVIAGGAWYAVVDAATGEVLLYADNMRDMGELELRSYPWQAELPYNEATGRYEVRDEARCFEIYDAEGYLLVPIFEEYDDDPLLEKHGYIERNIFQSILGSPVGQTYSEGMIEAPAELSVPEDASEYLRHVYAGMALAYDYFSDVLDWEGFNGRRGNIKVVYNCEGVLSTDGVSVDNIMTFPDVYAAIIVYMDELGKEYAADPGSTVHEYAHGVERVISNIASQDGSEGSAIKEAVSDIFAELAEAYATGDDPDWENAVRRLYEGGPDTLYNYAQYVAGTEEHKASTIMSYGFYRLWYQWRDSMSVEECMDRMSQLLFRGLFLLPYDASFYDMAYAVRTSGRIMERSGELTVKQYDQLCESLQDVGLLEQESTCMVKVTDLEGVPIEGASVIVMIDGDAPVLEDDYANLSTNCVALRTNDDGLCSVRMFDGGSSYQAVVSAEGYEAYCGQVDTIVEQGGAGDVQFYVNRIELCPAGGDRGEIPVAAYDEGQLRAALDGLVAQYGLIELNETQYGYGEDVPAGRLSGLLCADIYDYDGDAQSELFVVRLDTGSQGESNEAETGFVMEVYDWDDDLAMVKQADALEFDMFMTIGWANSAVHFARGASDEGASVYVNYYYDFNSRGFGTLRIEYDGELHLTGGVESDEYNAWISCYEAVSDSALNEVLGAQLARDVSGWEQRVSCDWEEVSAYPAQEHLEAYADCYRELMAQMQLEDPDTLSMYINPERRALTEYDPSDTQAYLEALKSVYRYEYAHAASRFDERYRMMGGTLTAMCGASHLSDAMSGDDSSMLECYDATGQLDRYREA